jgi:hypothetical protein
MLINCSFAFDDLDLLGVRKGMVFIRGIVSEEDQECVLAIKKRDFNKMFKSWIKEKETFCNNYGYFCGSGGIFYCQGEYFYDTKIIDRECDIDIDNPNWKDKIYKSVVAYKVVSYSEQIDMEHG